MMFTIFLIIAAWNLPLPYWLQVCLTVFGVLAEIFTLGRRSVYIYHHYND